MQYWLEHDSLMELRKAAGVEDPSWMSPAGWKVWNKLSDRNWQLNGGMTSAEVAEMKKLKETVEKLKSEMKVLCGSITASNQRGALPSLSISHEERLGAPERAEEEEILTQVNVSHVINELGIMPPIKAKPMRYRLNPENALPLMLSACDETGSVSQRRSDT